jgi:aspartate kinase
MGKVTDALERLTNAYFYPAEIKAIDVLNEIKKYHFNIIEQLFPDKNHPIYNEINNAFVELDWAIEEEPIQNYNHTYDQIVCMGEIISTKIVNAYLNEAAINSKWLDVRDFIQTDNTFREGKVDWSLTQQLVDKNLSPLFLPHPPSAPSPPDSYRDEEGKRKQSLGEGVILVTQGFIGGTSENFTTTLSREGSDYTAAILAFTTNAESVTIWKDVAGVLNADPKWFDETIKIDQLSYQDAIELAYYGATVIHPKTIKPLQNKKIPLYVKSFLKPNESGTVINEIQSILPVPCFIFKVEQVLISIFPKDFSFIVEENLSVIFKLFADKQVKINAMQNSAISFSVCVDNDSRKIPELIKVLQNDYRVLYNQHLELITIRYYDEATIKRVTLNKEILLDLKSRHTAQLIVKSKV